MHVAGIGRSKGMEAVGGTEDTGPVDGEFEVLSIAHSSPRWMLYCWFVLWSISGRPLAPLLDAAHKVLQSFDVCCQIRLQSTTILLDKLLLSFLEGNLQLSAVNVHHPLACWVRQACLLGQNIDGRERSSSVGRIGLVYLPFSIPTVYVIQNSHEPEGTALELSCRFQLL